MATSDSSANLTLLLDTHTLVWLSAGDARLSVKARDAIVAGAAILLVSAVTAWEYADLERRGRFDGASDFGQLIDRFRITLLDYPANLWRKARSLPDLHRDPVDRMLIAHAIHEGATLVTADAVVRRYPVRSLW